MMGIRCFVAVDIPSEMREEIRRLQGQVAIDGVRLVRPELVHVTLKFLGDQSEERVEEMIKALAKIRVKPFPARIKGMGAFPGRSIRVIWLGLEGSFLELYDRVEEALCPFGIEREMRGFSPHVTLGRLAKPSPELNQRLAPKIAALSGIDLGSFMVGRFFLKKSTLTRGGPIYDDLATFSLPDQE
jgi:RNA 2',3'-cyclic 3'-phosphodiesterase